MRESPHADSWLRPRAGPLLLDELNSLAPQTQAKLLRFLQSHEFRRLGSPKLHRANVRIIAATNSDLRRMVETGEFRLDLYHRLFVLALDVPALRDRSGDTSVLSQHFLTHYSEEAGREGLGMSAAAYAKLEAYSWPGNVRELQAVIQRAVLLCRGSRIDPEDIELPSSSPTKSADRYGGNSPGTPRIAGGAPSGSGEECFRDAKARVVAAFERRYLSDVLSAATGNVTHAARMAGMQRRDFQRLLRKHELRREQNIAA